METKYFLTELRLFKLSHFRPLLHYGVCSLCNRLCPQFLVDLFQTMPTFSGHDEDMPVVFNGNKMKIGLITAF